MKNLLKRVIIKRRRLRLEEKDVIKTLNVINHLIAFNKQRMIVGSCGWGKESTKWFIHFNASELQWSYFKTDLKKEGLNNILHE